MGELVKIAGSVPSSIAQATEALRLRIMACPSGTLLGNEDALLDLLAVSRPTLRQIARILEREGLLEVRRGLKGGYYAVRPDLGTIEAAVSAHLATLAVQPGDALMVASALWVASMRAAVSAPSAQLVAIADAHGQLLDALPADAPFKAVLALEQGFREAVFALASSGYVQLIFRINAAFASRTLRPNSDLDGSEEHRTFVSNWRKARKLELAALRDGDAELAELAARRERTVWDARISQAAA